MVHFRGIEGLRGWLAVVVVLDHIFGSLGYFYLNGAMLLHHYVELPSVNFGKALFKSKASRSSPDPVSG